MSLGIGWTPGDLLMVLAGFAALCLVASLIFVLFRLWATRS